MFNEEVFYGQLKFVQYLNMLKKYYVFICKKRKLGKKCNGVLLLLFAHRICPCVLPLLAT